MCYQTPFFYQVTQGVGMMKKHCSIIPTVTLLGSFLGDSIIFSLVMVILGKGNKSIVYNLNIVL